MSVQNQAGNDDIPPVPIKVVDAKCFLHFVYEYTGMCLKYDPTLVAHI